MDQQANPATGQQAGGEDKANAGLLCRIRGEFGEMPGLRLSIEQATRLWSLDRNLCHLLMSALLDTGFLARDRDGRYLRAHGGY